MSVVYNSCWSSPAQSLTGPCPVVLMTIFYCLRFETPQNWRVRSPYSYPPGTEWRVYTLRHWVPLSSPPTTRRATVEVCESASTPMSSQVSQSRVTTDGQSASLSWNKAPIWDLRPDFYYCQTVAGLLVWGALSDERTGLSFTIAPGPRQSCHFRVLVSWDS
jgi:hypothetical protein